MGTIRPERPSDAAHPDAPVEAPATPVADSQAPKVKESLSYDPPAGRPPLHEVAQAAAGGSGNPDDHEIRRAERGEEA